MASRRAPGRSLGAWAVCPVGARREHVTVALSGQGADELLGGYPVHRNAALADRWGAVPARLRPLWPTLARHAPRRYRRAAAAVTAPDPVTAIRRSVLEARSASTAGSIAPGLPSGDPARSDRCHATGSAGTAGPHSRRRLYLHQQLGLVDDMLHYFDRASMARSLEVRVPFLDHHVVEFCAEVPDRPEGATARGEASPPHRLHEV